MPSNTSKSEEMRFSQRMDLNKRWEYIARVLPPSPAWALDIGANDGDTLRRLANAGYYALGIEVMPIKTIEILPGTAIMNLNITSEILAGMPRFDVIFFLSVLHRIYCLQGAEAAERTLTAASLKTDILIIEGSSSHARYKGKMNQRLAFTDMDLESCIDWHREFFNKSTGGRFSVAHIGTNYSLKSGEPRPTFLLRRNKV